jgi:superfamily I DNA and RNA helicase
MFDHKELWLDIGYSVIDGKLEEGKKVALSRSINTSPDFLEQHSPIQDLIKFKSFKTDEEQTDWLVNEIVRNLKQDELQPSDIIVINPDPITTRSAVAQARRKLLEKGINSNLAGVSTSPDVFFEGDKVTFTGIFRAKGNEAAMVYVINAQDCFAAWRGDLARVRNRLFTAITRSKAWVRVLGYGEEMEKLEEEYRRILNSNFHLEFKYPTAEERAQMRVVNRDMTAEEKKRIRQKQLSLEDILESLESGETVLEDYPDDVIEKFRRLLGQSKK